MHRNFWSAGHRIFGLHGVTKDGRCECGNPECKAALKHPLVSNWQHTPVWSEEQIEVKEASDQFKTGYGVLVRGLLVIDVDARNGGTKSYERLLSVVPQIAGAGLIVETGSGGGSKHLYFKIDEGLALQSHLQEYKGIDFKSSGFVVGPGSLHASGNRYKAVVGTPEDIDAAPQALIDLLRKPERHRAEINGQHVDVSHADLADMLKHIDPDTDHETWIRSGMAVHHATGGTGFDVWDKWSGGGTKYPGRDALEKRWHSFGKSANPVTLGTLVHYAEQGGWQQSVEFEVDEETAARLYADYQEPEQKDGLPFDIAGVDLKRPPGFVGRVTEWINDQCRRPREHVAVATALNCIGNIVGLRYTDDLDNVTTNTFVFCVADSGTGKDAILKAATEINKAAGIHPATHGAIKSEQEIARNLTRHQAALYFIDEFGIWLGKVKNAQQRGGAIYLDGTIGYLMSAYTKADGNMLLTGDMKEHVLGELMREQRQLEKHMEEKGSTKKLELRVQSLQHQISNIDSGLQRPFLSLMGFTTSSTFTNMVDHQSTTNGFLGRALIFVEHDSVPKAKKKFKKRPMPDMLKAALSQLYTNGEYDMSEVNRVEYYYDKAQVPTTERAVEMLEGVSDWFEAYAEELKSVSNLEALGLRAYELVAKISLILAVPEGIRTEEHVRWAFALVKRDIDAKANLVISNDREKDNPLMALQSKIAHIIGGEDGEAISVVFDRLRRYKKPDVEKCLNMMIKNGTVLEFETVHKYNKKKVKRYKMK
jgi:hypothetical protein